MCKVNKIIKSFVMAIGLLCCGAKAFADNLEYIQPFNLRPVNDGILLGAGTLLSGSALICDKFLDIKYADFDGADLKKSDIPAFDQIFMRPYSNALHIVGTGTMLISMASPLIFATVPNDQWLTIGVMYAETLLIANGLKEWLKILVDRPRPYMYFEDFPESKVESGDWNCSFPSGHTTMSFAGAAFTSYLFNSYFPDSSWRYAVTGISFGLATLTAALRMGSGNHFFTDVLTGAILGTACGFLVPYMHSETYYKKFQKNTNTNMSVTPMGVNVQFKF